MQTCKVCGEPKPLDMFTFRKDSGRYRTDCKRCVADRVGANFDPAKKKQYDSRPDVVARQREWRKQYYSRSEVKERGEQYWSDEENKKRKQAWTRQYQAREDIAEARRLRQTARNRLMAKGDMPRNGWTALLTFYGARCMKPDCGATERLELDHVVPLSIGGDHTLANAQILCKTCNISKMCQTRDYRNGIILEEWRF